MADAPWRCSQCGTINEPVANSCRTCGRWPSLFDLERSMIGTHEAEAEAVAPAFEPTFETDELAVETFEPQPFLEGELHADTAEPLEPESSGRRRSRLLRSLIVPIAFVIYIVITIVLGDRGS